MKNFGTSRSDVFPTKQLMHSGACGVHGIEYHEVASAITTTFKSNNGYRVSRLLKVDGREESLLDVGAVGRSGLCKISLNGFEQRLMGLCFVDLGVTKHLNSAVNLRTEEKSLCLYNNQCYFCMLSGSLTSGVPIYFLVSRMPPV